jgi:hypothetical protein
LYSTIRIPSDQESQAPLLPILPSAMPRPRYIPRFLQFHHYIHSEAAERIYRRTSISLLRVRIHDTRRALDDISRALLGLDLLLDGKLSTDDWALLDRITFERQHSLQLTIKSDSAVSSSGYTGLNTRQTRLTVRRLCLT